MKQLSDILPLYGVEHDIILSKMGDITLCYLLELPEIFTMSEASYAGFHEAWVKAIKLLPVGGIVHKQDWYINKTVQGDFDKPHSFLSLGSERFFHERPYLHHQCYLMLTLRAKERKAVNSIMSSLLRKHIVPVETRDRAFVKNFESICAQFIKVLADQGGIQVKRLIGDELVQMVNYYLRLHEDDTHRDICFDKGLQVGESHCEMYALADADQLPGFCSPRIDHDKYSTESSKLPVSFVSSLGQLLACEHIYNQFIIIEDPVKLAKELEARRRRLRSLSGYARENVFAKEGVESFLNELTTATYQPVRAHFHVLAWIDDPAGLPAIRNLCAAAFAKIDGAARMETAGAPQLYWAGIPGNAGDIPINDSFLTFSDQACCFLNAETNYRSSLSPFGIRLGERITGRPVHVDISDEPMRMGSITNRNKIVIGPSGSGKSFFTNHMTRSYHAQGAHIVIVDVGHSYRSLCELVGGYYFTYSEQNPIAFNPFYVPAGGRPDTEKKESIKALLITLWKKEGELSSRSEYVALSLALQGFFEKTVAFRSFNSFYEYIRDEFTIQLATDKVRNQDFDVAGFLYVLKPYYKGGEFDYLLNASKNLDMLDQRFIVFELDNIKDHPILFPVVTLVIMELFISKMRSLKGVRKMMLIEEAWKAIARNGMAEYIKYLFKTARKHFAEAVVVTQEIEDILSSEIVKQAIINNADCKILLDQAKYQNRFTEIEQLLGLTQQEKSLILSMNRDNDPAYKYKEVFISLGNRVSKVYRLEVSPEEYLTYTTEETEKHRVTTLADQAGGIEAAIKHIVNEEKSNS